MRSKMVLIAVKNGEPYIAYAPRGVSVAIIDLDRNPDTDLGAIVEDRKAIDAALTEDSLYAGVPILSIRQMTVDEQVVMGWFSVTNPPPVIHLENGARLFPVTDEYAPGILFGIDEDGDKIEIEMEIDEP